MFVIGMSRRIARAGSEGDVTVMMGRAGGIACVAHAAARLEPRTATRYAVCMRVRYLAQLRYYIRMAGLFDGIQERIARWLGSRLGIYTLRGFTVAVDNARPDIATPDALERLDESLALIEHYQPWRLAHLRRGPRQNRLMRIPCRRPDFADH